MPRLGIGLPLVSSTQESPITLIEDLLWEDIDTNNNISVNYQETRTNSVLHSQDATDAEAWTKTNTAIDSTLYEAPDNSTTANAIKSDSTGTKVYRILQGNLSVTTGKTYTLSVHVKKGTLGFARVQFNDSSVDYSADFNLNTAAVTNTSNTIRTQVDSMDDDWYRCSITFQVQNTTSSGVAYVFAQSAAGSSTPNVAVSGIVLLYVWGFQLEENSEPSAYIKTTTSSRTTTEVLNDFSNVWDFDSADLMPEENPVSEGAWETLDNLVLNNNFEDLGSEIIANGTFDLGSELVTNGAFDTGSNWTLQSSWSISGGKANYDAAVQGHYLKQTISPSISAGKAVKIQFDISDVEAGKTAFLKLEIDGSPEVVFTYTHFSAGTYTYYYKITSGLDRLNFVPATSSTGGAFSIDNVSVKEIVTWTTFGTGINIASGVFTSDGTSGNYDNILVGATTETWDTSEYYEVTFDVPSYTSGNFKLNNSTHNITNAISASGSYKVYFKPSTANTIIGVQNAGTPFKGTIDNISVKQVDPNDRWSLGTGWTISDGKAHADTSSTTALQQTISTGAGNTYEVTFTVSNFTTGVLQPQFDGILATPTQINSNGTHTVKITAAGSSHGLLLYAIGTSEFSIDNVTIKEYAIQPQNV